jgi:hypothetical protein
MAETGWPSNPYTPGSIPYYIWNKYIGPRINFAVTQKVVKEAEVGRYLGQEWTFVTQLKSGDVIIEKAINAEKIAELGVEQLKKQTLKE